MFKQFSGAKSPFGLDISDISLKLVQLSQSSRDLSVAAYSDMTIPKELVGGEKLTQIPVLADFIKKAVLLPKFGKVTTPFVVASLPETKCFVRVIQIPAMSENEAIEAVPWEAEAYIPLPISQVYLDWLILNPAEKVGGDAKMSVLITAAPKDYVDDFVEVLKQAGLQPVALESESQATARSVVPNMDETVLIADIDTVRTSLIIYEKGVLQFTSSLPIAGNMMTDSLAKSLNVGFEEAEKLKREIGIGEESEIGLKNKMGGRVKRALVPLLNNLVEEMKNTIRFYEEHSSDSSKISRLLLVGGSSKLKHLPSFLHDQFTHVSTAEHPLRSLPGMKVELGNPWINVLRKGQTPPMSRENSLSYATAIGLALRET